MSLAEEYVPRYTLEDYRRWEGDWEKINTIRSLTVIPVALR
ncbi:MAG: hypothetical protein N2257_07955 [Thermodesulfovibrionales bacterium]|nr:hypothetical protein [Thermodesulfovibrionales bacterium]